MTIAQTIKKLGLKAEFPARLDPMLASDNDEVFDDPKWLYEIKWDGYRILSYKTSKKVVLRTRNGYDWTKRYKIVADQLGDLEHDLIIDGELVAFNHQGVPSFNALQNYNEDVELKYFCFDLLWINGYDLRSLPLLKRKEILKQVVGESEVLYYVDHYNKGLYAMEVAKKLNFEGIVAKARNSTYKAGKSKDWLKTPLHIHQEFVIGAWIESESARSFKSLLFGHYVDGKFQYVGHVGTGFTDKDMKAVMAKLKPLEVKNSPFAAPVETDPEVHWVKPQLVVNIRFSSWTEKGKIRKPATFLGIREDKTAMEVSAPADPVTRVAHKKLPSKSVKKSPIVSSQDWKKVESVPVESSSPIEVEGVEVMLNNLDKEYWKGITKADVIMYYDKVASYLLRYLRDRPLGLNVTLGVAAQEGVFIRGMEGRQPEWATVFTTERKHKKAGKSDNIDWLVCNDVATMVFVLNLGSLDFHPWNSRTTSPDYPDYLLIDLDPSDEDFNKAIKTALITKQVLDRYKLKSFVKTSGKTGIHIMIPCEGIPFGQARHIVEGLCQEIHEIIPDITTTSFSIGSRGDKLYIDPSQNDYADRIASAYSLRAYKYPSISTPLAWREVKQGLDSRTFTRDVVLKRLKTKGDLLEGLFDKKTRKSNSKTLLNILKQHDLQNAA
jgi:bifunctional non-homologous end joining protein LigD